VETETLGFRWTAANNLLVPIGEAGRKEWKKDRANDPEAAERELCQFIWAIPPQLAGDKDKLKAPDIVSRTVALSRGEFPPGMVALTCGCDLGLHIGHWLVLGWVRAASGVASPHVVEYGRFDVPSKELGKVEGLKAAVRTFRDTVWRQFRERAPESASTPLLFDAGWEQETILEVAWEGWPLTAPCKGFGERQMMGGKPKDRRVVERGDGWRSVQGADEPFPLYEQTSDRFKSYVHAALQVPRDPETNLYRPGAMTLFAATSPGEHLTFARHVLSERAETQFVLGKGWVRIYRQEKKDNHFLDAAGLAVAGAAFAGVLASPSEPAPAADAQAQPSGSFIDSYRGRY
jgi:hypothetical protein